MEERLFKLPVNRILEDEGKNHNVTNRYIYYSGKKLILHYEYEIEISHIKDGDHYLAVGIRDSAKNKIKRYKIRSITKSSLQKLQERIDAHLEELGLTTKFVNHWQTLIDQGKRHLEEKLIVDISGDEITLKNGEKHTLYDWQRGKTIEELNRRTIEFYTTSIKSYEDSIKREDGE